MKRKNRIRILSVLLIVCLFCSYLPASAIAVGQEETPAEAPREITLSDVIAGVATIEDLYGKLDESVVPDAIGYDEAVKKQHIARLYEEEGNDLNKVIFLNADGSKTMYTFDHPVKYQTAAGEIQDISLDIADSLSSNAAFVSASADAVTTFSANLSDGISLSGNGVQIGLIPLLPTSSSGNNMAQTGSMGATSGNLTLHTATRLDEKTVSYYYDDKTTIEYSLTYTGFKEDIVVSEYTGQTEYSFLLNTGGYALEEIGGSYFLVDDAGNVKATIGDIIIFTADERNNTLGQIVPTTIREKEQYLLTIVIDEDYLADENTVYPIRIDPTVEITYAEDGAGKIEDATVYSAGGTTTTLGSIFVGNKQNGGIARILMKFPGLELDSLGTELLIMSAEVSLRDLLCEATPLDVSCYVYCGGSWSEATGVTWNDTIDAYDSYLSSYLDTQTISYTNGAALSNPHRYHFDITEVVRGWYEGMYTQDKGIIFKADASVENGSTYNWKTLSSYNRGSYEPRLSITYYSLVTDVSVTPSTATIQQGESVTLLASLYPEDADNQAVEWSTSNEAVAMVNAAGVVYGYGPGTAIITCSSTSGAQGRCVVTVTPMGYTTLPLNTPYYKNLTYGQHHWYQFTPSESGYYKIKSSSDDAVDLKACLYFESTKIAENDDGAGNMQFEINCYLGAGVTYRLCVQGCSIVEQGIYSIELFESWPIAGKPTILSRSDWGASNVITSRLVARTREPERIIFHHSADKFSNEDIEACKEEIKGIQDDHMNNEGKCDIAYHFIIDPAGRIWQGAAIDNYQRGHAEGYFDDIGVLVLGDFESRWINGNNPNTLNNAQKEAMIKLSKWLCYAYDLPVSIPNAPITTHEAVNSDTECPGDNMAPWVKNELLTTIKEWRT